MPVTRRNFEDAVDKQRSDLLNKASSQAGELGKIGKRSSSITARLQSSGLSSGATLAQTLRAGLARSSSAYRADTVLSGARVGTDNLTGAPLANESGSATLHAGPSEGSNVTTIGIPSPKSPLPGVPAQLTRGSPLLGNRQVLMNFLRGPGFGGGSSQGSSINTNSVPLDSECDPGNINVDFSTEDPPVPDPPLPEDQGGGPLSPGEPPPKPLRWTCGPTGCQRSESGEYSTLIACETFCQARYTCDNGDCIPDPNGEWANLSLCLNGCRSRFRCVSGECIVDPTGPFSTLIDCVDSGCGTPRWDCVDGECTETDSSGPFASAQECADSGICDCTPIAWRVIVDATYIVGDVTFGCLPAGNPIRINRTMLSKTAPSVYVDSTTGNRQIRASCDCLPFGCPQLLFSAIGLGCNFQINSVSVAPA